MRETAAFLSDCAWWLPKRPGRPLSHRPALHPEDVKPPQILCADDVDVERIGIGQNRNSLEVSAKMQQPTALSLGRFVQFFQPFRHCHGKIETSVNSNLRRATRVWKSVGWTMGVRKGCTERRTAHCLLHAQWLPRSTTLLPAAWRNQVCAATDLSKVHYWTHGWGTPRPSGDSRIGAPGVRSIAQDDSTGYSEGCEGPFFFRKSLPWKPLPIWLNDLQYRF